MISPNMTATQATLDKFVGDGAVPGAVIVVQQRSGDLHYVVSGGPRYDSDSPIKDDTLFRMYSMTKPITGVAVMMLIERGLLGLDQPLKEILPEFSNMEVLESAEPWQTRAARNPILIRHLLTHTAGFSYHVLWTPISFLYWKHGIYPGTPGRVAGPGEALSPTTLEEMCKRLAKLPLGADPGTKFEYSLSIDVLGMVVERVSGVPFDQFLKQELFDPLGMDDTFFRLPEDKESRLAPLYERFWDGWRYVDHPEKSVYSAPTYPAGGGGLISSTRDYAAFCSMLLHEGRVGDVQIMKPETVKMMRSNLLDAGIEVDVPPVGIHRDTGFGAAVSVATGPNADIFPQGVFGWPGAGGGDMWIDPANGFFALLLTQFSPPGNNPTLRNAVRSAVYTDMVGRSG